MAGYQHVYSPPIAKRQMYVQSGHVAKFANDMFAPMVDGDEEMQLRPSLCPHHAMVFAARGRSYRELPLRIAELGGQYRSERSGVLSGLSRVRSMLLNDAHVFCSPSQVGEEVSLVLEMVEEAHRALGFKADGFQLSLRGPDGNYLGSAEQWDLAEGLLRDALAGRDLGAVPSEAAFYGPKIDIQARDLLEREFTLATIQVDFALPERFNLSYVDSSGARARPVMVHRSLVGSMERLVAHLIEVHQGAFPVWYAPVQLVVLPIGEAHRERAHRLARDAMRRGLRVEVAADASLGLRLREVIRKRVPYAAVIGDREVADDAVSLRLRDGGKQLMMPAEQALDLIESVAVQRLS